jgi:hypothetical protein
MTLKAEEKKVSFATFLPQRHEDTKTQRKELKVH